VIVILAEQEQCAWNLDDHQERCWLVVAASSRSQKVAVAVPAIAASYLGGVSLILEVLCLA
jgi:hypothetical protein